MAKFDILVQAPKNIMDAGDDIHHRYFTIDTADLITFYQWYEHNPFIVTYAVRDNTTIGYYNIIPLTTDCGELFAQQAIKEEDMTVEHILAPEAIQHAQYAYLGSIAIADRSNFVHHQCVAAMLGAIAAQLCATYDLTKLKRIYANPTTFNGNKLVRKLGMTPVVSFKKPLKGNDIYALDITPETIAGLKHFADKYRRFINSDPWQKL